MTTTNSMALETQGLQDAAEHLTDRQVVDVLPKIMSIAEAFYTWAQGDVGYRDLRAQVDDAVMSVCYFADDEFKALAPCVITSARDLLEASDNRGFVAMGRIMQLDLLADHPEIMQLAARRARQQLHEVLHYGTLPARK